MNNLSQENIDKQREEVFGKQPDVNLQGACVLGDGVIKHSLTEKNYFKKRYFNANLTSTLFIPASGSGSRMFKFLYDFLESPTDDDQSAVERFLNNIQDFAFYELLPFELKKKIESFDYDVDEIIKFIIEENGLALGNRPKGLIPFHRNGRFIFNALQEQMLQGLQFQERPINFHFTINSDFKKQIKSTLKSIEGLTGQEYNIAFSEQDPKTHAIAFDDAKNVVLDANGNGLIRPAGHGALINNLNNIDSDLIFVKNIDNVQHEKLSDLSISTQQYLAGVLIEFKKELAEALNAENMAESLKMLNDEFYFAKEDSDFSEITKQDLKEYINRPIRVCGMVRNEGQPGGGPFWVEENGNISKQIVEKAQISKSGDQYRKMVQSKYFNPVMMVLSPKNLKGEKLNLLDYVDETKYLLVEKHFKGKKIHFREQPGLWNGGMAKWTSLFVEIPSETFSPVKTALDLLSGSHTGKL